MHVIRDYIPHLVSAVPFAYWYCGAGLSLYLSSIETPCSLFGYHRLDFREMSYFVLNIVRMREHHQWERNHIFNVFLHISLARLRTCASASAGVGKSHGSTRPVAITPRLRNIILFFPPQEIRVCSRSCCSSLLFVGDSECFGVLALEVAATPSRLFRLC